MQFQSGEALQQIMLARYYEAGLGRFVSVDPAKAVAKNLRAPQRWNAFTYAGNNPVRNFDPNGQDYVKADAAFKAGMEFIRFSGSVTGNGVMNRFEANKVNPAVGQVESNAAWIVRNPKGENVGSIRKQPGESGPKRSEVAAQGGTWPPVLQGGASVTAEQSKSLGDTRVFAGSQSRSTDAADRMPQGQFIAKEIVHETTHQNGEGEPTADANEAAFVDEADNAAQGLNFSPATPLQSCSGCNAQKK